MTQIIKIGICHDHRLRIRVKERDGDVMGEEWKKQLADVRTGKKEGRWEDLPVILTTDAIP